MAFLFPVSNFENNCPLPTHRKLLKILLAKIILEKLVREILAWEYNR